jgi:hypothetical protein
MCESSLLGLRGCADTQPVTGLYIDDLGVTESFLSQLITDQYNEPKELFSDKRKMAWRRISTDILGRINPFMKADTVVDSRRIGQIMTNATSTDSSLGSGVYVGVRVYLDPQTTSFLKMFISGFSVDFAGDVTDKTIYIIDLNTRKVLDSFVYTEGGVEQYVGKYLYSKRKKMDIAIVYESTEAAVKYTPKYGSCTDCGGRIREAHICQFVDSIGVQLSLDTESGVATDVVNKPRTGGMSLVYSIECDREAYICSIGSTLSMALAYATAVEIYEYALTQSANIRVNTTVSVNTDALIQARDIAASRYNEEVDIIMRNMRLPSDRHCFRCNENMRYVTALP